MTPGSDRLSAERGRRTRRGLRHACTGRFRARRIWLLACLGGALLFGLGSLRVGLRLRFCGGLGQRRELGRSSSVVARQVALLVLLTRAAVARIVSSRLHWRHPSAPSARKVVLARDVPPGRD